MKKDNNTVIKSLIKEIEFEISDYESSDRNMNNEGFYGNKTEKYNAWIKSLKSLILIKT